MSTSDILHLQKQIEGKKKQLRQLVRAYRYTDSIVLACSQELDQLVYLFIRNCSPRTVKCKNDSNSSIELESFLHLPSIFYHNWTLYGVQLY
ncbi:aspartyl-phosphate phosphatase Spo0E family protein [Bacillus toyonensis]|nr:aspartyl-phosphate phosphatase Spo0E family protein [Bacillus toyonensis]MDT3497804.1 aspartyl-phosphate phosphatase Spo0E family protein [Bacillus toyonensis]MDT3498480.1 aspartyl-phosphate phosphatase Spo0E family protein [Bacillus toyonensis]